MVTAIKSIEGGDNALNTQHIRLTQYLADAEAQYTDDNTASKSVLLDHFNSMWDYVDRPNGAAISVPQDGSLIITNSERVKKESVTAGTKTLYNLIPNTESVWEVAKDNAIVAHGSIVPVCNRRMINVTNNVRNVRDVGGMKADGGYLRHGLLFRGSEMEGTHSFSIDADGIKALVDDCGVKVDVDIRENPNLTQSPLGGSVEYRHIALPDAYSNYKCILDPSRTAYFNSAIEIVKAIMESVAANKPCYLHCTYGADRTGSIMCLIEAILGVAGKDIDIDFELTTFAYGGQAHIRTTSLWVALRNGLNALSGDSLQDKAITWAKTGGISESLIDRFRKVMIDGNPITIGSAVEPANPEPTEPEYPTNPQLTWNEEKNLSYADGVSITDSPQYAYCDYVKIDPNSTYTTTMPQTSSDANYRVLCYDASKSYLGVGFAQQKNGSSWKCADKYSNCAYVRFRLYANSTPNLHEEVQGFVLTKN